MSSGDSFVGGDDDAPDLGEATDLGGLAPLDLGGNDAPGSTDDPASSDAASDGEPIAPVSEAEAPPGNQADENTASVTNDKGEAYPEIIDPRTGEVIPFPEEDLEIVPPDQRVAWGAQQRRAYIEEWESKGFEPPPGGWEACEIHHIKPREYGGTNDFDNHVPVPISDHRGALNPWWAGFKSG